MKIQTAKVKQNKQKKQHPVKHDIASSLSFNIHS